MKYLSGHEIYLQYISNKSIDVPPLAAADEMEIQTSISQLTTLAFDLNATPGVFQWFMFGKKREYQRVYNSFMDCLRFWTFKRGVNKSPLVLSKAGKA